MSRSQISPAAAPLPLPRSPRGPRLSTEERRARDKCIRTLRAAGLPLADIADMTALSKSYVGKIARSE
jgi:DNA-binding transcriptional MerR regulator